jgi:hypothetical protein
MRIVCIIVTTIALVASPACAQSARKAKAQRLPQAPSYQAPAYGVYSGERRIGTDPDPNIRFELLREQNWRKGG